MKNENKKFGLLTAVSLYIQVFWDVCPVESSTLL
jgi:hypothetical protein